MKVRSVKGDHVFTVSNLSTILAFKQLYIDKIGEKDLKPENVRLFCLGKEFKDEMCLYSYDLIDEMTV